MVKTALEEAIAELADGFELHAVSDGDVDFAAAVRALVSRCGRGCSLVVVTAAAGVEACGQLLELERSGAVGELLVLANFSLLGMNGPRGEAVKRCLGARLRLGWVHTKYAVASSPAGCASLVTTANLNRNRRAESWFVTLSPSLAAHLLQFVADLDVAGAAPDRGWDYYHAAWGRVLGGSPPPGPWREELARW